jgi:tricarballylate dehydrogenase
LRTDQADVVVVGLGNAAQSAAASAHEAGARVLVLEKAPENKKGGNTWFSHGAQFRHTHAGVEDIKPLAPHIPESEWEKIILPPYRKDDYYNDLMRLTKGRSVPELAELLVNESYPTMQWMAGLGIQWEILYSGASPDGDRFRWPPGSSFTHPKDGGAGLVDMWYRILQAKGIEVRFEHAAVGLVTDDRGGVCGVQVQEPQGLYKIHCRGVVLACGGFEASPALRAQFLGAGWDLAKVRGSKHNTGEGLQMALDIGAASAGHWSAAHATPIDAEATDTEAAYMDLKRRRNRTHRYAWPWGIMVNAEGRRFVDEGEDFHGYTYAKTGQEILKQPGGIAYQIFDQKVLEALKRNLYEGGRPAVADTFEDLAGQIDVNPVVLAKTVSDYNDSVDIEVEFNEVIRDGKATRGLFPPKSNWAQRLDKPPYLAYPVTAGLTFTYGGLKINPRCQVVNRSEKPIPGLFAAGELTAGFFFYNYPSGAGMTRGAVTGRISGRNASGDA